MNFLKSGLSMQPLQKLGLTIAAAGLLAFSAVTFARDTQGQPATLAQAAMSVQAQQTYQLIRAGGPFPYPKDGVVFGNRERQLPGKARGYYREYTVKTPGERSRGARRIVCGGAQPTSPEACYFTADHYASFSRIVP